MEQTDPMKRQVAYKIPLRMLSKGSYHKIDGAPNFLLIEEKYKISRVNVIATVLDVRTNENKNTRIDIDDSTGKISVRIFDGNEIKGTTEVATGDCVLVIGKPREYNGEIYLIPEIIQKLDSAEWVKVRVAEFEQENVLNILPEVEKIELQHEEVAPVVKETIEKPEEQLSESFDEEEEKSPYEQYLKIIESLDARDGAPTEEVITQINALGDDGEKIVEMLLKEGEVFEIKAGKIKILG